MPVFKPKIDSAFLRHNAILFAGSVLVGALNYLYYPIVGRILKPADFGEVQTLISLFLQLTIFLTVIGVVGTNIVTHYKKAQQRDQIFFNLEKLCIIVALSFLVVSLVTSPFLKQALNFNSAWPFVLLALSVAVSVPLFLRLAFLRGKQQFLAVSLSQIISAIGKLILSWILVVVGLGTMGAMLGLVAAQIVAAAYTWLKAHKAGLSSQVIKNYLSLPDLKNIVPELKFSFFVLIGSLGVIALFSVDVIIVKYFFDANTAGLYAGVATVGRTVFFLTASVAQVLLASVGNSPKHKTLLVKSLVLITLVTVPIFALFCMFPSEIVSLLMGQQYSQYAFLLPLLVVANFTISIINLLVLYFLALRRAIASVVAIMGFVASCVLMILNHDSLNSIVYNLLIGSSVTLVAISLCFTRRYLRWRKNDETSANISSGSSP